MSAFQSLLCGLCVSAALGCGEPGFTVKYVPGYSPAGKHVSVFGVKRDGLMNRGGWAALGPGLSAPFNGATCDVAYSDNLFDNVPELARTVDDYVRANGVSDDLLAELAPAAKGDTIMLVTIAGHPLVPSADVGSSINAANAPASSSRGGRSRRRGGQSLPSDNQKPSSNRDPFDVSAMFYSVNEHRSVAMIELVYDGSKIDEALSEFRAKLETEFPGSTCSGWDWKAHVDEAKVRALNEQ